MRAIWLTIAVLTAAALAEADVVYLRNGTMLQGQTVKEGDMIVVRSEAGETKVALADVVHIVRSEEPAPSLDAPLNATSKPGSASRPGDPDEPLAPPPVPVSVEGAVNPAGPERTFSADRASLADTQVFAWERVLGRMGAGAESYYLRQEIERARGTAHERKRRVGTNWLGPKDFAARRAAYAKKLAEAEELINRAGRIDAAKTEKEIAQYHSLMSAGNKKLQEAADVWADPLLRRYLLGLASLWGQDADRGELLMASLTKECPLVAGYQQGHGMALFEQKRGLTALGAYIEMMQLRPDARGSDKQTIVDLVEKAMHLVPGHKIKTPTYQRAQELVDKLKAQKVAGFGGGSFIASAARKNEMTLLMPDPKGRSWQTRGPVLPVPPYDRMMFRQAVGVPIGPELLLVDAKAAADAMEIYVQVDSRTVAPAQLEKPRGVEAGTQALTLLRVKGYAFHPLLKADPTDLTPNTSVVAFATDFYSEMGNRIRTVAGKVVPAPGNKEGPPQFTMGLLAGEGTAPILMGEDSLVGFLGGRIDTHADHCGLSKFIPTAELDALFKSAKSDRIGVSVVRRPGAPPTPAAPAAIEVAGKAFLVYFIVPEVLE
ncbi:MAG: hypothetical protein NT031_11225 [Planctomycetota bacterium]|nr:hypothetical protein [Planctomycetota bacterium]